MRCHLFIILSNKNFAGESKIVVEEKMLSYCIEDIHKVFYFLNCTFTYVFANVNVDLISKSLQDDMAMTLILSLIFVH